MRGALSVTPPESYSGLDLNQHTPLCKCFCLSCIVLSGIIVLRTVQLLHNAVGVEGSLVLKCIVLALRRGVEM